MFSRNIFFVAHNVTRLEVLANLLNKLLHESLTTSLSTICQQAFCHQLALFTLKYRQLNYNTTNVLLSFVRPQGFSSARHNNDPGDFEEGRHSIEDTMNNVSIALSTFAEAKSIFNALSHSVCKLTGSAHQHSLSAIKVFVARNN